MSYSYIHRLQLAALHYNKNSKREQAKTKTGNKRYAVHFPKYKKGGYIVRKLLAECTYGESLVNRLWAIDANWRHVCNICVLIYM